MAASPRSTSLTNASGLATVSFTTGTLVASGTVTATDGAALTGTSSTITTIAGAADPAKTTISAFPTSVSVDGTGSVDHRPGQGPVRQQPTRSGGTVTLSSTHGSLTSVTDNTDGTYSATLTDTLAGTDTVSGTINAAAITSGDAT